MEFKKKLKTRLIVAVSYILLGLVLVAVDLMGQTDNYFYASFGFTLVIMGLLRIFRHRKITVDERSIRQQELTESDERTRMIAERARSWTFSLTVTLSGAIVLVLNLLGYHDESLPFAWLVCGMVTVYWICYLIIRKKY